MDAVSAVRAGGGVARSVELVRAGVPKGRIEAATRAGELVRLRRVWVALPDADPELLSAARHGVVLTCVTQARRAGLWVLAEDVPHVAAPPHSGGIRLEGAVVHWGEALVPRHPHALEDAIENVLVTVARCQPFEAALTVWESALRHGLADRQVLERMPLPAKARDVLARAKHWRSSRRRAAILGHRVRRRAHAARLSRHPCGLRGRDR
jgi:hypothetical protein